ncbi:MAG TPA: DUF4433 domain-containing protein [Dehalococcoidia bacterium]
MEFSEIVELHYITPIVNLPSILLNGILSNRLARQTRHDSVADEDVQDRRRLVRVPTPEGSRPLHSYANLYFDARNPMMFVRRHQHNGLIVVRVGKEVMHLPGVVVTDCNASSDHVRFGDGIRGLKIVDRGLVFAERWTSDDQFEYFRRKSARCAEVLVPDRVPPAYINGAYCSNEDGANELAAVGFPPTFEVTVNARLFFR